MHKADIIRADPLISVSRAISTGDVTHSSHKRIVCTSPGTYDPRIDTAVTPGRCCYQPRYPECPSKQLSPFFGYAQRAEVSCNAIGRRTRGVSPSGRHRKALNDITKNGAVECDEGQSRVRRRSPRTVLQI